MGRSAAPAPAAALLAVALAALACSGAAPASPPPAPASGAPGAAPAATTAAPVRVRQGHPAPSVQYLHLFVAQEQGFYREQGLDVELAQLPPNVLLAALSAGEMDYTAGVPGGIRLALQGQALKVVAVDALQGFTFMTQPGITAPEQLRGKPVAVTAAGSAGDQAMRRGLAYLGLDPQQDVAYVTIGDPATQVQAMRAGSVEAVAPTLPHSVILEREGFKPWVRIETLHRALLSGLVAPQSRIDTHRAEVLAMIRAERAAVRSMRANRDATIAVLARRLDLAPELAAAVYDQTLDLYLESDDPDAARDALQEAIASERAAAPGSDKDWNELVDSTLAREAARS